MKLLLLELLPGKTKSPQTSVSVTIISNNQLIATTSPSWQKHPAGGSEAGAGCLLSLGLQGPEVIRAHPDSAGQLGAHGWAWSAPATSPLSQS